MSPSLLFGLCALLLGCAPVCTAAGEEAFVQANRRFQDGDFAGAAATYEQVLAADGPRAAVFYNLGNSYQRLGKNGPAILAYERARLLTPRDPDLLANLALARKAATSFDESGRDPRFEAVLNYLSRNEWSWIVAGSALALGGLALLAGAFRTARPWLRQTAASLACLAVLGLAAGGSALYMRCDEARRGIVLSEAAAVRLSPFGQAESLGTPGPGRIVLMGAQTGDFIYVEVPGGDLRGWLATSEVAAITPQRPGNGT